MIESASGNGSEELVRGILRGVLNQSPEGYVIVAEDRLSDLGMTSIQLIQIVFEVERELGVDFPESDLTMETFESVETLRIVVDSLKS